MRFFIVLSLLLLGSCAVPKPKPVMVYNFYSRTFQSQWKCPQCGFIFPSKEQALNCIEWHQTGGEVKLR